MAASFREARQYERALVRAPVVLLLSGHRFHGVITRIGGGGVYIETDAPVEHDDMLLLRFRLPCFATAVTIKGDVRWQQSLQKGVNGKYLPSGIGVMFIDMDPELQEAIIEFVADTGNFLFELSGMLAERDPDLARIQTMLAGMQFDEIQSLDELRTLLRQEMNNYFERF